MTLICYRNTRQSNFGRSATNPEVDHSLKKNALHFPSYSVNNSGNSFLSASILGRSQI